MVNFFPSPVVFFSIFLVCAYSNKKTSGKWKNRFTHTHVDDIQMYSHHPHTYMENDQGDEWGGGGRSSVNGRSASSQEQPRPLYTLTAYSIEAHFSKNFFFSSSLNAWTCSTHREIWWNLINKKINWLLDFWFVYPPLHLLILFRKSWTHYLRDFVWKSNVKRHL